MVGNITRRIYLGFSRIGVIPMYIGKVFTKKILKPKVKTSSNNKIQKKKMED